MRSSPNFDVVKEPRGFIKCLEVFLAVFAFSCATGYRGIFTVHQSSPSSNHKGDCHFKYPFDDPATIPLYTVDVNGSSLPTQSVEVPLDQRSSVEFFVVIGVFCFLYSLIMLVYYIFFEEDNARNATASSSLWSAPIIDFAFGSFWTLFWFFSACAFAAAVTRIRDATDVKLLIKKDEILHPYCSGKIACEVTTAKYATLTIAALLGFLNVFVWGGNLWFLWKETPWHNKDQPIAATIQQPQQTPQAAAI